MKAITSAIFEKMLNFAEGLMANEQWSAEEISVFKSDPVIRLLYGACAEEIGNLQEEIFHVKQRLIIETIEKMLPEEFHTPLPAHAVMYARPIDKSGEGKIGIETQFTVRRPEKSRRNLTFTPAGFFSIFQAEVKYLFFRDSLFMVDIDKKERIFTSPNATKFQSDLLWIGIKDPGNFVPREKLTMFFNVATSAGDQNGFYNALKYVRCSVDNQYIPLRIGLMEDEIAIGTKLLRQRQSATVGQNNENTTGLTGDSSDIREKILNDPDFMIYKLIGDVREWYHKYFITLGNLPARNGTSGAMPEELARMFSASDDGLIKDNVYWLKFSFSNLIDDKWVNQLFCSINSFPVLNLKLEKTDYNVESMPVNIYPVNCDDYVLCLNSVRGKVANRQEEGPYRLMEANPHQTVTREGDALFRKGGLGRQDPRKLKNMLNLLANLLKEEAILLTKDGTREDLNKLNLLTRALNDFDSSIVIEKVDKLKQAGSIILKPVKFHSKIFVRFWSTAADEANAVKPLKGEEAARQCELGYGPEIRPDSIRLLTATVGGRKKPSEEEHLDTVRKLLLTRGRVVTVEDIKTYCYEQFSGMNIDVEVRKNVGQSKTPGFGLVRNIEIIITIPDKDRFRENELEHLKDELLLKLEQDSETTMPFVIIIQ